MAGANLGGANLREANLGGADLRGADLREADLSTFEILPEGTIIGYKKLRDKLIAKLEIPLKAKRVHAYGSRKCRAEYAKVLSIVTFEGKKVKQGYGMYDETFKYVVGKTIRPDSFNSDPRIECSNGVHFFITKQEAINYI